MFTERKTHGSRSGGRDGQKRRRVIRTRVMKIKIPEGEALDYKNLGFLQKFLTERGKIMSHRVTGIPAIQQRKIARAIKRARFLGLLSVGASR